VTAGFNGWCQHLELLLYEGKFKREIQLLGGIPISWQISIQRFNIADLAGDYECVMSTPYSGHPVMSATDRPTGGGAPRPEAPD
ncbi:MAG: hypothetical protein ACLPQI_16925, partial [Steroidobacteraceae bacterium]